MELAMRNTPQSAQTARPEKYPQGRFNPKPCKKCGTEFSPSAPSHLYCSQECADYALECAYYQRTYGISKMEVLAMFEAQGGLCAICHTEGFVMKETHKAKLMVDHCHATGAVRGLLCHNCNRGLGLLKDSETNITRALDYLKGSTTIPSGSRAKRLEAHGTPRG